MRSIVVKHDSKRTSCFPESCGFADVYTYLLVTMYVHMCMRYMYAVVSKC